MRSPPLLSPLTSPPSQPNYPSLETRRSRNFHITRYGTFEHGGRTLTIVDEATICAECKSVVYVGGQITAHELAVADAIRAAEGLLSAAELRNVRLKYHFKQTDMEQMLSTGPKTWTRWERGKITQSKAADKLIRLLGRSPEVARELMEQSGVNNPEAALIFRQIEESAKVLTRVALRAELQNLYRGDDAERFADQVAERAFDTVRDSKRQAAEDMIAA